MIRVALCDDVAIELDLIYDQIEDYHLERGLEMEIFRFSTAEELLGAVNGEQSFDLYILDMIMPGMQGIELGLELRNRGENGKIIYLTATSEYAVDSYAVHAFFYLLKPVRDEELYPILDQALEEAEKTSERKVLLNGKEGERIVDWSEILYIEIVNRAPRYHLQAGEFVDGKMLRTSFKNAMSEFLDSGQFTLCGASMAVNLQHVICVDHEEIHLAQGNVLYSPRLAMAAFRRSWKAYLANEK